MTGQHRLLLGVGASLGVMGAVATSGLLLLAHRFVDELSHPHTALDESFFTFKLPAAEPEPPRELRRPVIFHTIDKKILCGDFWAQPEPAPTIVICHGYRLSREYLRPVAALEYSHGYNVLLFDFRGHGQSESVATTGGNAEVSDLDAAITVACRQPETLPGRIIIHGFSMGASIALLMKPRPEVVAIIADSPFAQLDDVLRNFVSWQLAQESAGWASPLHHLRATFPALSWTIVATSRLLFRARFGHQLISRPARSFKRWRARSTHPPILLIHGMQDSSIPISHARKIVASAEAHSVPLETYYVEGAGHCGAYGMNPEQYVHVLREFVKRCLNA